MFLFNVIFSDFIKFIPNGSIAFCQQNLSFFSLPGQTVQTTGTFSYTPTSPTYPISPYSPINATGTIAYGTQILTAAPPSTTQNGTITFCETNSTIFPKPQDQILISKTFEYLQTEIDLGAEPSPYDPITVKTIIYNSYDCFN